MLVPLLCAATLANGMMAVLELKNKLKGEDVDAGFLADEVRSAALKTLPGLRVITKENMLVLLRSTGRKLEDCEGECEVDTGRRIGADLVVSGELLKFGTSYKLDLKLHETADGRLLAGAIASGKTIDELDAGVTQAVKDLLAPLQPPPPVAQPPRPPAQQGQPPAQQGQPPAQQGQRPAQQGQQPAQPVQRPAQQQAAQPAPRPAAAPPQLLEERLERKTGLIFVRIPPGLAHLGCASGDARCPDDEKPPRTAQMPAFWIGRTEVPVRAYAACVKARQCNGALFKRDFKNQACNFHNRRPAHPLNCVTWPEAQAFCRFAGGRLPTAAEWEYAAKAGADVIYPWGNEPPTGQRANFCDRNCRRALPEAAVDEAQDDGWAATAPVGTYLAGANRWSLLDMAGNVSEWTLSDRNGQKEIKGGNWAHPPVNLRSSHRAFAPPNHHDAGTGFRCLQGAR